MDSITVDCEIQKNIEELPHGWADTDLMGVGVACVWEDVSQRFKLYGPDDVEALRKRILRADRVTTYNGWAFDYPVVFGIYRPAWEHPLQCPDQVRRQHVIDLKDQMRPARNDLLRRIWQALGKRQKGWKLDDVCRCTLGRGKIGDGADAPKLFQEREFAALHTYVLDDVSLERDLSHWIDEHGYVLGPNGRLEIPPWRAGE